MEASKEIKRKSIFLAIVLNILFIGSGHYYVKDTKKAFIFYPILITITFIFYYLSTLISIGFLAILPYILYITIYIYAIYDVIKIIKTEDYDKELNRTKKLFIYLFVFITSYVLINLYTPIKKYRMPAGSMKNTIMIGDHIIVNKFETKIERGDIVAFQYPKDKNIIYTKRCVAKGGDIIFIKDKKLYLIPNEGNEYTLKEFSNNKIMKINTSMAVEEPYKSIDNNIIYDDKITQSNGTYKLLEALFNLKPIKIPENHYFMMGDNRDHSNDSRFWGTVPKENIVGKVKSIFINFDDMTRAGILLKEFKSLKTETY